MIKEIFREEQAKIIRAMVLSPQKSTDKLIWNQIEKGMFTVKSSCHLKMEKNRTEKEESSSSYKSAGLWKQLRSLHISGVAKTFLWRACNNALQTKLSLQKGNCRLLYVHYGRVNQKLCDTSCGAARMLEMFGQALVRKRTSWSL